MGVLGAIDLLVEYGNVLEEPQQVHLLLVTHPHHVVVGLPGDRQYGRAIHLGIVETVKKVDRAGAAGGKADTEPPGELGVAAGHERRALLVSHLHEADALPQFPQPLHEAIDAIAGQAEDHLNAPRHQPFKKDVRRGFGHWSRHSCSEQSCKPASTTTILKYYSILILFHESGFRFGLPSLRRLPLLAPSGRFQGITHARLACMRGNVASQRSPTYLARNACKLLAKLDDPRIGSSPPDDCGR
jgi:hypothetical protein